MLLFFCFRYYVIIAEHGLTVIGNATFQQGEYNYTYFEVNATDMIVHSPTTFEDVVFHEDNLEVFDDAVFHSNARFRGETRFQGEAIFQNDAIFREFAEFLDIVEFWGEYIFTGEDTDSIFDGPVDFENRTGL